MNNSSERVINIGTFIACLLQNIVKWPNFAQFEERRTGLLKMGVGECLKGQSHQDLVLSIEGVGINSCLALLKRTVLVTKIV